MEENFESKYTHARHTHTRMYIYTYTQEILQEPNSLINLSKLRENENSAFNPLFLPFPFPLPLFLLRFFSCPTSSDFTGIFGHFFPVIFSRQIVQRRVSSTNIFSARSICFLFPFAADVLTPPLHCSTIHFVRSSPPFFHLFWLVLSFSVLYLPLSLSLNLIHYIFPFSSFPSHLFSFSWLLVDPVCGTGASTEALITRLPNFLVQLRASVCVRVYLAWYICDTVFPQQFFTETCMKEETLSSNSKENAEAPYTTQKYSFAFNFSENTEMHEISVYVQS